MAQCLCGKVILEIKKVITITYVDVINVKLHQDQIQLNGYVLKIKTFK